MLLTFQKLEIEHFRSFGARQEFPLNPSTGLWLLKGLNAVEPQLGANGAGKSSVWAALCWCLYGRTAQGLKNPDIKPWAGSKTPRVTLTLTIDKKKHVIERTAKTNGVLIDGKPVDNDAPLRLVGISFETFVNTLYLAQGLPLFFDRTPGEKLKLLTEVLPLAKWDERSARAAKRTRELETLESEMSGELSGLKVALEQSESLMAKAKTAQAAWEKEREERAAKAGTDIAALEKRLKPLQSEADKTELALETSWIKVREMREDLTKLRDTENKANEERVKFLQVFAAKEVELDRADEELESLSTAKECPTCGQPIKKHNVAEHKKELEQKIKKLLGWLEENSVLELEKAHKAAKRQREEFEVTLAKAENETDVLTSRGGVLNTNISELTAQITAAKAIKTNAGAESNPYNEQIQSLRRQKAKVEADIEGLEDDILKAQKQIERTRFWVKGFKDVALYLIEEVLAELEAVTNATLGEVGLVGWRVNYAMERETKAGTVQRGVTVTVLPPEDYVPGGKVSAIKWESWSGGEEQRLRLVGAIALSDVLLRHAGVQSNLEIYDEPAKYISGAGVSDLCAYLKDRAKSQDKTIFLVDHLVREGAYFEGTITVQKTEDGSIID